MEDIKLEKGTNLLDQSAELLSEQTNSLKDLVAAIRKYVTEHSKSVPNPHRPNSIVESRFTPALEAFEKGTTSCGAMVNISAYMLRHLGYKVKLVHGECKESVDHAWISVYDPVAKAWEEYDVARNSLKIEPTHMKKEVVDDWEEIRDQIIDDQATWNARRKERGFEK